MVYARLLALMIYIVLGTSVGCSQTSDASAEEAVSFQSGTYTDLRQILTREPPTSTIEIAATLAFPDAAKNRHPVVIVVHTLGGYQEANEGWHAAEFRKAGFATLSYDSFAARGMSAAAAGGAGPGVWASAVADAYAALRYLADHPKIDGNRVAIVGFSFGGEVAHLTALASLRAALQSGTMRFVAHISYYPAGVYAAARRRRRLYRGANLDAARGKRRQFAGRKGRGVSHLCEDHGLPGQEVSMLIAPRMGTARHALARVAWIDERGEHVKQNLEVTF